MARALERHPRFVERVFTPTEREYCLSRANPAQHFAARFAGKEAVGKALGFGVPFTWREIEIAGRPKPGVSLTGPHRGVGRARAGRGDRPQHDPLEGDGGGGGRRRRRMIRTRPLYDAGEMRAADAGAITEIGIPGAVLMERAGVAAAQEILRRLRRRDGRGRLRRRQQRRRRVRRRPPPARRRVGGRVPARRRPGRPAGGRAREPRDRGAPRRADARRRPPRPAAARRRHRGRAARHRVPRRAAARCRARDRRDGGAARASSPSTCPSGVDASTGRRGRRRRHGRDDRLLPRPQARDRGRAGPRPLGRVVVADIGIPPQADVATAAVLADGLTVPGKRPADTKYTRRRGARRSAARAASRARRSWRRSPPCARPPGSCGWRRQPDAARILEARVPEVMVRPLPNALELLGRADAVALGPGLGRTPEAIEVAREVGIGHAGPTVIDADGLFAFNGDLKALRKRRCAGRADAARGRDGAAAGRGVGLGAREPARGGAPGGEAERLRRPAEGAGHADRRSRRPPVRLARRRERPRHRRDRATFSRASSRRCWHAARTPGRPPARRGGGARPRRPARVGAARARPASSPPT